MKKFNKSIGFQLSTIMAVLVLLSLGSVILIVNHFIRASEGITAEANNLTLNTRAASSIENELSQICSSAFQLIDMMSGIVDNGSRTLLKTSQSLYFQHNPNVACLLLVDNDSVNLRVINSDFFSKNNLNRSVINEFFTIHNEDVLKALKGNAQCVNTTNLFKVPSMGILVSCGKKSDQVCAIIFSTEVITDIISLGANSINNTYVVNSKGEYLLNVNDDLLKDSSLSKKCFCPGSLTDL